MSTVETASAVRAPREPDGGAPSRRRRWLAIGLGVVAFVVFSATLRNGFVSYDDPQQIADNQRLAAGLSAEGVRWAFGSFEFGNWHPLTWVAHLATAQLFGLRPAGFHLAGLLLHCATTVALFVFLARATGRQVPAAFAAALFALHPLRVESVAWAAELKDPLSGLFVALALLAHHRYAQRPGAARALAVAAAGACALMAKPTAVVLPALLLVLDWWPLGRFPAAAGAATGGTSARRAARLIVENIPLLGLAAAAAALTYRAQDLTGAVRSYEHPAWVRAGNAAVSLAAYLGKTLWPRGLSFFYPHPGRALSQAAVAASVLALSLATAYAWRQRRARPWLAAGWAWYLVAAVPVSGLVQAGYQSMADRYTYLPLIGFAFAAAYAIADDSLGRSLPATARWGGAVLALACCASLTPLQVSYWRDSRTLYSRALALDAHNWNAHLKLGELSRQEGDREAAIVHLRQAVERKPDDIYARTLLGLTLGETGRTEEAIAELSTAVRLNRWWADAYLYLGVALLRSNRLDEAEAAFQRERALNKGKSRSLAYLGFCNLRQGNLEGAARHAALLLSREPRSASAQYLDGMVREANDKRATATTAYRQTLTLDPLLPKTRTTLERTKGSTP